jgi:CRP/FNR family cyclic AMP-dependent transcriptional regulator
MKQGKSMSQSILAELKKHAFTLDLKAEQLDLLSRHAVLKSFKTDEQLFVQGTPAKEFFLLTEGRVVVNIFTAEREPIVIQSTAAGEVLGWSWMMPPYEWLFDASAVEETQAVVIDAEWLRNECERDHHLGFEVMKGMSQVIARRLYATRKQLLEYYGARD